MKYHPGLTLDAVFRQALAVAGPDRLLFGTDSSFFPRGWQQPVYEAQRAALDATGVDADDRANDLRWQLRAALSRRRSTLGTDEHAFMSRSSVLPDDDLRLERPLGLGLRLRAHRRSRHARPGRQPADLVLTNGKIVTVDDAQPEAQALAVARRPHRRARHRPPRCSATSARRRRSIDAQGPARDPRVHRGPRPLHRRRRGAARIST